MKALTLLGVVLALLTPLDAGAHSGHVQDSGGSRPLSAGLVAVATEPASGSLAVDGWFRPCPDGPGNTCSCGVPYACTGNSKAAAANGGSWSITVAPLVARIARLFAREAPPPSRTLPPIPPRGPPLPT